MLMLKKTFYIGDTVLFEYNEIKAKSFIHKKSIQTNYVMGVKFNRVWYLIKTGSSSSVVLQSYNLASVRLVLTEKRCNIFKK